MLIDPASRDPHRYSAQCNPCPRAGRALPPGSRDAAAGQMPPLRRRARHRLRRPGPLVKTQPAARAIRPLPPLPHGAGRMTWTHISDTFRDDPRLLEISRDARLLHVEALVYCNQHLTDGVLAFAALPRIADSPDPEAAAAELEAARIWMPIQAGAHGKSSGTARSPPRRCGIGGRSRRLSAAMRSAGLLTLLGITRFVTRRSVPLAERKGPLGNSPLIHHLIDQGMHQKIDP